jgi:hypothetical protein
MKSPFKFLTKIFNAYIAVFPGSNFAPNRDITPKLDSTSGSRSYFYCALKGHYTLKLRYLTLKALWFQNIFSP